MSMSFINDNALHSMAATLASYDHFFGPRHPQTLAVMTHLGRALWLAGDAEQGRKVLERAALDLSKALPPGHPVRVLALSSLSQLLVEQGDLTGARLMQREVIACRMETGGLGRWTPAASSSRPT
jgi:hypothetical protein